jgi:hypothetical protein
MRRSAPGTIRTSQSNRDVADLRTPDRPPVARVPGSVSLPVMTLTPFSTSRNAAGPYLADVVLSTTHAPNGSYVDRGRVARSSDESYAPQRERDLWDAAELCTAAHAS